VVVPEWLRTIDKSELWRGAWVLYHAMEVPAVSRDRDFQQIVMQNVRTPSLKSNPAKCHNQFAMAIFIKEKNNYQFLKILCNKKNKAVKRSISKYKIV
jgi:hypothetical protein